MAPGQGSDKLPIIGRFLEKPPSPIFVGTVAVLAIVVLVAGPWYVRTSESGTGAGAGYISFNQLLNDYDFSTFKFRSHDPGDTVIIRDIVSSVRYYSSSDETRLRFYTEFGSLSIYVYGDVSATYPAGTSVIIALHITENQGSEIWEDHISQSQIWKG